jgi:hypothetical protein
LDPELILTRKLPEAKKKHEHKNLSSANNTEDKEPNDCKCEPHQTQQIPTCTYLKTIGEIIKHSHHFQGGSEVKGDYQLREGSFN